jgi:hypothetical protein
MFHVKPQNGFNLCHAKLFHVKRFYIPVFFPPPEWISDNGISGFPYAGLAMPNANILSRPRKEGSLEMILNLTG